MRLKCRIIVSPAVRPIGKIRYVELLESCEGAGWMDRQLLVSGTMDFADDLNPATLLLMHSFAKVVSVVL